MKYIGWCLWCFHLPSCLFEVRYFNLFPLPTLTYTPVCKLMSYILWHLIIYSYAWVLVHFIDKDAWNKFSISFQKHPQKKKSWSGYTSWFLIIWGYIENSSELAYAWKESCFDKGLMLWGHYVDHSHHLASLHVTSNISEGTESSQELKGRRYFTVVEYMTDRPVVGLYYSGLPSSCLTTLRIQ